MAINSNSSCVTVYCIEVVNVLETKLNSTHGHVKMVFKLALRIRLHLHGYQAVHTNE